jgi:CheY-like chemotaxis protein
MGATERMLILVADDDPDDILLLKQAFQRNGIGLPVHACANGAEAIAYLQGEGEFADRDKFPFPRFLFTDLKMPRCSGFELLQWLANHPDCKVIPAIVLSGSAEEIDVKRAYQLGANAYFQKPSSFDDLVSLVKIAAEFWARSLVPMVPSKC